MDECRALREWAENTPIQRPMPASADRIAEHLAFMASTLPTNGIDDESGKKRSAVYVSLLRGHSDEALAYMARTACATLRWLPTPSQCLALLKEYRPPISEREEALRLCHAFTQACFEEWTARLKSRELSQVEIDDVPDRWRRIAEEQGHLRRINGRYEIRPLLKSAE
jgi:hypothetical protein